MTKNLSPKNPESAEPILAPLPPEVSGLQYPWLSPEPGQDPDDTYVPERCVE
jgi:hypothetical protein